MFILNLQIFLKLKRKLFLKNSRKIGSQNYFFRCYLIFVLTRNFVSCRHLLLFHTEKHTIRNVIINFVPNLTP